MPDNDKLERRVFSLEHIELREDGDTPEIVGYAAVFNSLSEDLGGFREEIAPGFFDDVLGDDVRALFNHDPNYPLGRTAAGTLALEQDSRGLKVRISPPPTQWAEDLQVSMRRGDVSQMSFGWYTEEDEWSKGKDGLVTRRLIKAERLLDVSPVTFPAYPQTSVEVRAKVDQLTAASAKASAEEEKKTAPESGVARRHALRKKRLQLAKRKGGL